MARRRPADERFIKLLWSSAVPVRCPDPTSQWERRTPPPHAASWFIKAEVLTTSDLLLLLLFHPSILLPQVNKQQLQAVKERFLAFLSGETQIVADEAFCNAVRSFYEARPSESSRGLVCGGGSASGSRVQVLLLIAELVQLPRSSHVPPMFLLHFHRNQSFLIEEEVLI